MAAGELIGQQAPSLTLLDASGQPYELQPGADGIPVALSFYPEAGSYGCRKEACQFRDLMAGKLCHCIHGILAGYLTLHPLFI